jgi:hypothetical protein
MKYIINESKLSDFFDKYIKREKPDLYDLEKMPLEREDGTIYGYEFVDSEGFYLIFEYLIEPWEGFKYDHTQEKNFPQLKLSRKVQEEMQGLFGYHNLNLMAKWFEDTYKLPVKTIKERIKLSN